MQQENSKQPGPIETAELVRKFKDKIQINADQITLNYHITIEKSYRLLF
jgi:hypothetical protein